jgi:hypothetical protein
MRGRWMKMIINQKTAHLNILSVLGYITLYIYIHGSRYVSHLSQPCNEDILATQFPSSAMLSKSSDTFDKILQYTAVAADNLQDVANRSQLQIPYLDSICTLLLTIIPIVQVQLSENDSMLCLNEL